jgi:gamma-glutamyltranspeptidase/glutathione hydrolase
VAKNLAAFPASRHLFQRDGNFYKSGDRFVQPQLARTLTRIAADPATFYTGAMAGELAVSIQQGGGLITAADLAAYRVHDRAPLTGSYRGYDIVTAPPPSSGGIVLLEILNILSGYDLAHTGNRVTEIFSKTMKNVTAYDMGPMGDRTATQVHLITEAFRRAYMDRDDYLADPDFVDMPIAGLTSKEYAAAWRKTIDPVKASPSATLQRPAGFLPPAPGAPVPVLEHPDTTHFSIVDAEGNVVANTYTLNNLYGSGVTAGGLGFLLNDEMDDFTSAPGVPNQFGLVQGVANRIQPGKRPLSSMTPTIVLKDGKPLLVLGSPGGSTIITTVANDIISILDNGLNVQQAADAPRFHHQYLPDVLQVEKAFPQNVADQLRAAGYTISHTNEADEHNPGVWGDSEMIYIDPKTGALMGADDQRHKFGKAAGY